MSASMSGNVPRGTLCKCGAPVDLLKAQQCRRCYKKDHSSTKYYQRKKAEHPTWGSMCQRGQHRECSGFRLGGLIACDCECHLGICPTCHLPSERKTVARLSIAAARVRQLARELEAGLTAGASR